MMKKNARGCVAPIDDPVPLEVTLPEGYSTDWITTQHGLALRLLAVGWPHAELADNDACTALAEALGRRVDTPSWSSSDHGSTWTWRVTSGGNPVEPLCGADATEERIVEEVVMPLCARHALEHDAGLRVDQVDTLIRDLGAGGAYGITVRQVGLLVALDDTQVRAVYAVPRVLEHLRRIRHDRGTAIVWGALAGGEVERGSPQRPAAIEVDPDGWTDIPGGGAVGMCDGWPVRISTPAGLSRVAIEFVVRELGAMLGARLRIGEWSGPAPGEADVTAPIDVDLVLVDRRAGEGGETRCGDLIGYGARRLCGPCAQAWADAAGTPQPRGCGVLLERSV